MKLLFTLLTTLISLNIYAQTSWDSLNFKQQELLLPFKSGWDNFDENSQNKLIKNTNKWLLMSPQERKRSQSKLNRFKDKTPEQQERIKNRVKKLKQLSPQERKRLKGAYKKFKKLSPEKRKKLKKKFNKIPPGQRKKAIALYMRNQQLKRFINSFDISKRPIIRQMFKELSKEQNIKLKKHIRLIKPDQRHKFVLDLIDLSQSERNEQIEKL